MKIIIPFLTFIIAIFSLRCSPNQSNTSTLNDTPIPTVVVAEDLQKVFCSVDLGSAESDITNNRAFLFAHHISPNLEDYPTPPNWKHIDSIYQNTSFDTMTNQQKNIFQQVASIQILRNHALLTHSEEKEKIAYYTKMYLESGGKSAGLLFYCLVAMGDSLASTQKKSYVTTIASRSAQVTADIKNWMQNTQETLKNQDFPEEVKKSLKTDFANLENIIKTEQAYVHKLQTMLQ